MCKGFSVALRWAEPPPHHTSSRVTSFISIFIPSVAQLQRRYSVFWPKQLGCTKKAGWNKLVCRARKERKNEIVFLLAKMQSAPLSQPSGKSPGNKSNVCFNGTLMKLKGLNISPSLSPQTVWVFILSLHFLSSLISLDWSRILVNWKPRLSDCVSYSDPTLLMDVTRGAHLLVKPFFLPLGSAALSFESAGNWNGSESSSLKCSGSHILFHFHLQRSGTRQKAHAGVLNANNFWDLPAPLLPCALPSQCFTLSFVICFVLEWLLSL